MARNTKLDVKLNIEKKEEVVKVNVKMNIDTFLWTGEILVGNLKPVPVSSISTEQMVNAIQLINTLVSIMER